jgi:hypothetical protein
LHPIIFFASRRLGAEIDIHGGVRIDNESFGLAADSWPLLVILEHRAGLIVVEDHRPKVGYRNIGRQVKSVVFASVEGVAFGVHKCRHILRPLESIAGVTPVA